MSSSVFEREICEIDKNTYFVDVVVFVGRASGNIKIDKKHVFLSISKISLSKTELLIQKFRFPNTFAGPLRDGHFGTSAGTTSPNATVAMRWSHSFGGRDTWSLCLGCYTRTAVLPRPVHVLRRCVEELSRYVRSACIPHLHMASSMMVVLPSEGMYDPPASIVRILASATALVSFTPAGQGS